MIIVGICKKNEWIRDGSSQRSERIITTLPSAVYLFLSDPRSRRVCLDQRGSLTRIEQAPQPTNLPDLIGPAAGSTLIPCDRQDSPCVRTRTEPVFDDESLSGTAAAAIRMELLGKKGKKGDQLGTTGKGSLALALHALNAGPSLASDLPRWSKTPNRDLCGKFSAGKTVPLLFLFLP